jgi:hypothetical protein
MDCVSAGSFESISFQRMLAFHVSDRRVNGGTPFHQSPQPFLELLRSVAGRHALI